MSADLDALVALMPFAGQLGLALDKAGADRVVARLDWAAHLCTTAGVLHGGVLMSVADSAGALVTFLGLPEGEDHGHDHLNQSHVPAGHRGRCARWRCRCTGPDHGDRPDQRVRRPREQLVAQTTQVQAVR